MNNNAIGCYDLNGNSIEYFFQWDSNQYIVIEGVFASTPFVDFWNKTLDVTYRMTPTSLGGDQYKVEVPNVLFTEAETMILYIYSSEDEATKYVYRIPVKPKKKPSDYTLVDNVEYVSLTEEKKKLEELESSISSAESKRVSAENSRVTAENNRVAAENNRVTAENNRVAAENNRVTAENNRVAAETERVEECEKAVNEALMAADKANIIAEDINGYVQDFDGALSPELTKEDVKGIFYQIA